MIKLPVFKEEKCYLLYNKFCLLWLCSLLDPPTVFGTNLTCLKTPRFARIFFQYAKIFSESLINSDFFTSGIGTDIF